MLARTNCELFYCAYAKLITSVVLLGISTAISDWTLHYNEANVVSLATVILVTVTAIDAVFNIIFVVAVHKDNTNLLQLTYKHGRCLLILSMFLITLFINMTMYELWYHITDISAYFNFLPSFVIGCVMIVLQIILIVLTRKASKNNQDTVEIKLLYNAIDNEFRMEIDEIPLVD